jgi:hypothetical protein
MAPNEPSTFVALFPPTTVSKFNGFDAYLRETLPMKNHQSIFAYSIVVLDGNEYEECVFDNCTLVYKGGAHPKLIACTIKSCKWMFEDAALRTMHWLATLNKLDKTLGETIIAGIRGEPGAAT